MTASVYLEWLPIVLLMLLALLWMTACTLSTSSGASSTLSAGPTALPQVTLTVRVPITQTPTPTRLPAIQIAAQPTTAPPGDAYTVRENDTLLDIALRFGISVDALQAANPAVDPLSLQIGQELTIPTGGNIRAGDAIPEPAPPPLP
ncbi:MAG: LysM peptidoglycan-binding domain-containing protein, partial [Chloroflexota bacterium]